MQYSPVNDKSPGRFRRRWWLYCSVGFILGHVLFGLIGHGFTGPHEGRPTGASAFAHTLGLVVVGLTVFTAQRVGLKPWLQMSNKRLVIATLSYVAAFQLAAYVLRPPFDHVFGIPVLGVAAWISLDALKGCRALLTAAVVGSFWLGVVVTAVIFEVVLPFVGWELDSSSLPGHTMSWLIGGGAAGVVGGYTGAWPLSRLLVAERGGRVRVDAP